MPESPEIANKSSKPCNFRSQFFIVIPSLSSFKHFFRDDYIDFKSNANDKGKCEVWNRMYHFYQFNREAFMQFYHKHSNVESTFSMIKAKFGGFVRSKLPMAQVNEVLCKILCHNICVVIQSMSELGIEATFWN